MFDREIQRVLRNICRAIFYHGRLKRAFLQKGLEAEDYEQEVCCALTERDAARPGFLADVCANYGLLKNFAWQRGIDLLRRKTVDEVAYTDDLTMGRLEYKYELVSKYRDPLSAYVLKETVGEIEQMYTVLDADDREIMTWRYVFCLPPRAIAQELQLDVRQVYSAMARSRRLLKNELAERQRHCDLKWLPFACGLADE